MTTFTYKGYLSTHKQNGDATKLKSTNIQVVTSNKDTPFSYKRATGNDGITLTSPILELRIDGKVVPPKDLDADIVQISWTGRGGAKAVTNVLIVTLGDQQFTMQISGNDVPALRTARHYNDFIDSIRHSEPLTWGFYGPGEKIPYDRIMNPGVTEHDRVLGTDFKNVYNAGIGNDQVWGKAGNDVLKGAAGSDKLLGGKGNDRLFGGEGRDSLQGDAGKDLLRGESGADKLYGGLGGDKLYGGQGADIFVFKSVKDSTVQAKGRDVIEDFSRPQGDKIDLKAIDADAGARGNQAFDFIGNKAFSGDAGELRFERKKGDTSIFADVNGDGKADFSILLDANVNLRGADFIL